MYIPSAHKIEDPELILDFMRSNPFVTLISVMDGQPVATHLPILVDNEGSIVLCGHIARQNKQWKAWNSDQDSLVIFAGPHGYVSPSWYESRPNVPTWNYVSIHAYGKIEIIDDGSMAIEHLERLVAAFDPVLTETMPDSTDREFYRQKLPGIVVFRMPIHRIDAKAKLNQNKSEADRLAIRNRYVDSALPDEQKMAALMGVGDRSAEA